MLRIWFSVRHTLSEISQLEKNVLPESHFREKIAAAEIDDIAVRDNAAALDFDQNDTTGREMTATRSPAARTTKDGEKKPATKTRLQQQQTRRQAEDSQVCGHARPPAARFAAMPGAVPAAWGQADRPHAGGDAGTRQVCH
jgi:hypothetical protein